MTVHKNFKCLNNHPLIKHKITIIRDKNTSSKCFRTSMEELTLLVASEALRNLTFNEKVVETPLGTYNGIEINNVILIPIIRAGLSMMPPLQKLLPDSKVGFIGISRNHDTLEAEQYYVNIPDINENETVLILDPMLATGNTLVHTIKYIKENKNVKNIILISVLATPLAVQKILKYCPDCLIYSADMDEKLNENGYIVPGLGDAGDRTYNT